MIRASGLVVGFTGAVVLAAPWHSSTGLGSLAGVGACLLAAACYGVRRTIGILATRADCHVRHSFV